MEARTMRGANAAAGDPQPVGPLSERVGQLKAALTSLGDAAIVLESGLGAVLSHPAPPDAPGPAIHAAPTPPQCELDEAVCDAVSIVRNLERRLLDMHRRCQL